MGLLDKLARKKCAKCGQTLTKQKEFGPWDIVQGKMFTSPVYCEKCRAYYCTGCELETWQKREKKGRRKGDFTVPQFICPRCGSYIGGLRL